jgi:hypothetical protein
METCAACSILTAILGGEKARNISPFGLARSVAIPATNFSHTAAVWFVGAEPSRRRRIILAQQVFSRSF